MLFLYFLTVFAQDNKIDKYVTLENFNQQVLPKFQEIIKHDILNFRFLDTSYNYGSSGAHATATNGRFQDFEFHSDSKFGVEDDRLTIKLLFNVNFTASLSSSNYKRGILGAIEDGAVDALRKNTLSTRSQQVSIEVRDANFTGDFKFNLGYYGDVRTEFNTIENEMKSMSIKPDALRESEHVFSFEFKQVFEPKLKQIFQRRLLKIIEKQFLDTDRLTRFVYTRAPDMGYRGLNLIGYREEIRSGGREYGDHKVIVQRLEDDRRPRESHERHIIPLDGNIVGGMPEDHRISVRPL